MQRVFKEDIDAAHSGKPAENVFDAIQKVLSKDIHTGDQKVE